MVHHNRGRDGARPSNKSAPTRVWGDMDAPSPFSLPVLPYLRLRVTLRAEEPAELPPYQGSLLRGAFGHALRRLVCVAGPRQPCATCRLRRGCHYTRLFETFIEGPPPPFLRGLDTAPRPYVFEPDVTHLGRGAPRYAPGDPLGFDLLLFGQATELAGWVLLAVERMATAGLGARRARFALDRVEAGAVVLCEAGRWTGRDVPPPSLPSRTVPPGERVTLRLQTPLRLQKHGGLATGFSVRDLAFPMLRRVLELATFHGTGPAPDWTLRPLLEHAGTVRAVATELRWFDWERYSNRQERTMNFGGLLGRVELEGDLAPLAALLRTAEIVHVGKGATFGLGKVELE
ncbi:MAG TPA: hypothetical protein DD490_32540 [Acidobacteria bacterium]|nr:hypothetical protein [Acidobacteriota bacterium]